MPTHNKNDDATLTPTPTGIGGFSPCTMGIQLRYFCLSSPCPMPFPGHTHSTCQPDVYFSVPAAAASADCLSAGCPCFSGCPSAFNCLGCSQNSCGPLWISHIRHPFWRLSVSRSLSRGVSLSLSLSESLSLATTGSAGLMSSASKWIFVTHPTACANK